MSKSQLKPLVKPSANPVGNPLIRSFVGYLEGTHKAEHTIKNYRLDLLAFQEFLRNRYAATSFSLQDVTLSDLDAFHEALKAQGLKTNTRRRKLLTVRKFLAYLSRRNKISDEVATVGAIFAAPEKIERIPFTVSSRDLIAAIRELGTETLMDLRNRTLLWVLAETGCQVSELTQMRFDQWVVHKGKATVEFLGKGQRTLEVSPDLAGAVEALRLRLGGEPTYLFLGFNKFGPLGGPITPRGVEMLVKAYGPRLIPQKSDFEITPRTFRHSAVLRWFAEGRSRETIQKNLGLKTAYAFRAYEPLFKSSSKATSSS